MTDEIEEGELYSDEDELNNNSTKTKSIKDKTFGLKNQLNNEEKQELNKLINNTFGADEEDEDFVAQIDNPYDEEDVGKFFSILDHFNQFFSICWFEILR